jgi:hypothetical protein
MNDRKLAFEDFGSFEKFSDQILTEIIREGERELDARLSTANASDQRALSSFGFQITLSLAVCAGLAAIAESQEKQVFLLSLGIFTLAGLVASAVFAYESIIPKLFRYPGNRPDSWFIKDWHTPPLSEELATMQSVKVEQCYCLYSALYDNKKVMERNAELLKHSLAAMSVTIAMSLFGYIIFLICANLLAV